MGRGAGTGERSVERERSPASAVGISQHGPKHGELEGGTEGARRRRRPPAHPAPCATGRGPGPRGGAGWRAWHCTAQCRVPDLVLCGGRMAVQGDICGVMGAGSPCSATSPGGKLTFLCAQTAAFSPPAAPGRPAQCRAEEGGRKRGFPSLSAHARFPLSGLPDAFRIATLSPGQIECAARECPQKGRVTSLAENFPANHGQTSLSAWSGGGSYELRAVSPAWKFAWKRRDSRHGSTFLANSEFRQESGQGRLRGCAPNSLKFKA